MFEFKEFVVFYNPLHQLKIAGEDFKMPRGLSKCHILWESWIDGVWTTAGRGFGTSICEVVRWASNREAVAGPLTHGTACSFLSPSEILIDPSRGCRLQLIHLNVKRQNNSRKMEGMVVVTVDYISIWLKIKTLCFPNLNNVQSRSETSVHRQVIYLTVIPGNHGEWDGKEGKRIHRLWDILRIMGPDKA